MRPLRVLRRLHRRTLVHRRPLAALCVAGAVLVGLQAASPPPPATTPVWVAARDLPSGTVLEAGDLSQVSFTPASVPEDVVPGPRSVVGRTLAAPLTRGEPMTSGHTLGAGLLTGYPGRTAVPLRIADAATVALLRVGDRITFVAADPDGRTAARTIAVDVPVVAIPAASDDAFASGTPGRLVVVAVPEEEAREVATYAATSILIPVWTH
jgi:Flp pilus assembly protein CpaB